MNSMKTILLVSITLLIFVIGMSCASAASVDHNGDSLHVKSNHATVKKVNHSSSKKVAAKKTAKKSKKSTKKTVKKTSKKSKKSTKKANKKAVKKTNKKTAVKPVDKVINGWDPKKHQVSKKSLGDGMYRITYDDGYFRIVDEDGEILSYGY